MSGALLPALGTLGTVGSQALTPILGALPAGMVPAFIRTPRKIGTIVPDCVIEENHSDRVQVSTHPVADGFVNDHAYMQPASLTMRVGWTNSNLVGAATGGAISGFASGGFEGALTGAFQSGLSSFTEMRVKEVYEQMLKLQRSFQLMDIVTGKRTYKNMLLTEMSVKTDHTTEYALMMECHFQEILLAKAQKTTQPDMAAQSEADKTAKTEPTPEHSVTEDKGALSYGKDLLNWIQGGIKKIFGQ
jgi:hypothetical protein